MIAVVQRVRQAQVTVEQQIVGRIGAGLLVLAAVEAADTPADVEWMAGKLLALRIFRNGAKHFDLDIHQASQAGNATDATGAPMEWGLLLVSNFTVAAEASNGRRPSLSRAAAPALGRERFDQLVAAVRRQAPAALRVETGAFGADMQVTLTNDGPATFILQSTKRNP